MKIIEKIGIE